MRKLLWRVLNRLVPDAVWHLYLNLTTRCRCGQHLYEHGCSILGFLSYKGTWIIVRRDKRQPKLFDKYTAWGPFDSEAEAMQYAGTSEEATGMGDYEMDFDIVRLLSR